MEKINLSNPIVKESITSYQVSRLELDWQRKTVEIHLIFGSTGEEAIFGYSGDAALTLIKALNTANLSIKSLHRRIIEKLISDGSLNGSISGTPD